MSGLASLLGRRGLAIALVVAALVRLPAFGYDVISDDEAIYDTMGHTIADGGVMYHDTVDHKPPGLAYTYAACRAAAGTGPGAAAHSLALVHLVGLLAAAATAAALYLLARRLLDEQAAAWAALLYGVVSAAKQPADGLAVNGELLMNLPLALAALAAVAGSGAGRARRVTLDVVVGALVAVAVLFKYQAGVLGLALPLLVLDEPGAWQRRVRTLIERGALWTVGLALPLGAAALYFRHRGVLDEAVFWGLRFNREYLAQGPGLAWALQRLALQLGGVVLPGLALYGGALAGGLALSRGDGEARPARLFILGWSALSLWCVGLGARFFGHYFLQAELPLALVAAAPLARLVARAPRRAAVLAVAPLGFVAIAATPPVALRLFHAGDPDWRAIGRAAAAATRPEDTIWVWGNVPQIYYAADRREGVRFSFCNYLTGLSPATPAEYDRSVDPRRFAVPEAMAFAVADLERSRPALVLDTAEADLKFYGRFPLASFAPLAARLGAHYRRAETVAGVVFYRRID